MERRVALKSMAMAVGGLVSLPAWASGWNESALKSGSFLDIEPAMTLKSMVDTIIPKTDTPGAAELGVDKFVQKMITDCYDKKAQDNLSAGIARLDVIGTDLYGKPFMVLSKDRKLSMLDGLQKNGTADEKAFLAMVKNLTIQGFMSSEYVMTNITHYELVPGRYHGCVPVK